MEQNQESKKIEVVYTKGKLGKRLFAHFIDLSILFLSTMIFFTISNVIVTHSHFYLQKADQLTALRNESKMYEEGVVITTYVQNDELFPSYASKKEELSTRLDEFYHNSTYIIREDTLKNYNQRKLDATDNNIHLFVVENNEIVESNIVSHEVLYNFYVTEINDYALSNLFNNPDYFYLVSYSFLTSVVQVAILLVINFTVLYLVLPLTCFKRGRQTIGMKLEKLGLINIRAENLSAGVYVGRFFFMFLVFIPLNAVSFLIPTFVSVGMMYFTKTNSSLVNYVFNDYIVDVTNQTIYYSALEREESNYRLEQVSIENKDFKLK